MEIFIENKRIIEKGRWVSYITSITNSFDALETNKERAKRKLKQAIEDAVKKRIGGLGCFGILFSGGVDSTFLAYLCKQFECEFTCYTIGLEGSQDIEYAQKIARKYDISLKYRILSVEEFESVIRKTIAILKTDDIIWISVGSVLYATAQLALQDNVKVLFGGLGTEEIFAGYQRHEEARAKGFEAVHEECWNGLRNMWHRDLLRDSTLANHLGVELRTPYMDEEVIKTAMTVHPMYKISAGEKKIILREIAEEAGLEKEFAWRKKKAAQYGSNFVKGIDKLAKKHGFATKKEYLQHILKEVE